MHAKLKPEKLRQGDTIGIISLSSGAGALFPHRVDRGVAALQTMGFEVLVYPSVRKNWHGSGGPPEERAADLHHAFSNNQVRAILATIGGLTLNDVLPLLDYELIRGNPKVFCGYSDNTLLHSALWREARLVSFYGPCLMTQFGEYPEPLSYTVQSFLTMLSGKQEEVTIVPSFEWTSEFLDWGTKADLARPRTLHPTTDGHLWLREGRATGRITGGGLYSLLQVKGTAFDADYDDAILFIDIEPSQDHIDRAPLVSNVSSRLGDLRLAGVFSKIRGLVVGRPLRYSNSDNEQFIESIMRQTEGCSFPVLANVNIGHADPVITLPINVNVELDSQADRFRILECGVR